MTVCPGPESAVPQLLVQDQTSMRQRRFLDLMGSQFWHLVMRATTLGLCGGFTGTLSLVGTPGVGLVNITGVVGRLGVTLLQGVMPSDHSSASLLFSLFLMYLGGGLLTAVVVQEHRRQWGLRHCLLLTVECALLWGAFALLWGSSSSPHSQQWPTSCSLLVCLSCGLQNACTGTLTITGVATDLGVACGQLCAGGLWQQHRRSLLLWGCCLLGVCTGSLLGALTFQWNLVWSLAVAASLVSTVTLLSWAVVVLWQRSPAGEEAHLSATAVGPEQQDHHANTMCMHSDISPADTPPVGPSRCCGFFPPHRDRIMVVLFSGTLCLCGGMMLAIGVAGVFLTSASSVATSAIAFLTIPIVSTFDSTFSWWVFFLLLLTFLVGCLLAGMIVQDHTQSWSAPQAITLSVEATLLWVAYCVYPVSVVSSALLVSIGAGLQNGSTANFPTLSLRTVHITGTTIELGYNTGLLLCQKCRCSSVTARLWILIPLALSFFGGTLLGTVAFQHTGYNSLGIVACVVTTVAICSWVYALWGCPQQTNSRQQVQDHPAGRQTGAGAGWTELETTTFQMSENAMTKHSSENPGR